MAALMFAIVIASQFAARQEEKEKALAISNERFSLATRGANEGLFDWNITDRRSFFLRTISQDYWPATRKQAAEPQNLDAPDHAFRPARGARSRAPLPA